VAEGGDYGEGGVNGRSEVAQGARHGNGRAVDVVVLPGGVGVAAEGLGDGCVARVAPVWACLSESAEGGVDDVRFELLQLLVAEAEALHGACGEVLDYDV